MTREPASPSDAVWSESDLRGDPHRRADKPERVQRMFAAIARRYDLNNRVHSFGLDQRWRRRTVALCDPQAADDVLDAACGTGDLAEAFASAGVRSVTGVDFTEEMLVIARGKSARLRRGGMRGPDYRWADVTSLPFERESFDIVSIAFGIRNVGDPERALGEFRRVLRPGGRLAVLEFSEPPHPAIRALNSFYCRRIMPLTASLLARDRSGAYRYLPRSIETFADPGSFSSLLRKAGFPRVAAHPLTLGVCTIFVARV
jgi:demethylmenaquinone methyltransferase/2-methoxy-6-polyprenyl-1,4-benzoquinol methylase